MKLYTKKVECCGMCPGAVVRRDCVVGPSHLYCTLSKKQTEPFNIPSWCCLDNYEEPDGYINGERRF